jgi:hypothetical protein
MKVEIKCNKNKCHQSQSFHFISARCVNSFYGILTGDWGVMMGVFSFLYRLNLITPLPFWGIFVLKGLSHEMDLAFDDMYG